MNALRRSLRRPYLALGFAAAIIAASMYGIVQYRTVTEELLNAETRLASTTAELGATINALESELATSQKENANLNTVLFSEQQKNVFFQDEISRIAGAVGTLEKLKRTDPELLRKYSKVYFLNENYIPPRLASIDPDYLNGADRAIEIHADVWPRLRDLLTAANAAGTPIRIVSAYRSFGEQSSLKSAYTVTFGSGASKFSADQGYSEHQLGTTVDFTTPELGANFSKFNDTAAYAWLAANAHQYGFMLSYPKDNGYYVFEPWHWRFVGVELATRLKNEGWHFYDLDQRTIDEYLVKIFD